MFEETLTSGELLRRLLRARDGDSVESQAPGNKVKLRCVWSGTATSLFSAPSGPPQIVRASASDLEDLFAMIATLAKQVSPVSGLIHCFQSDDPWSDTVDRVVPRNTEREALLSALIAAEGLTRIAVNRTEASAPTVASLTRTLSFTLARAVLFYKKASIEYFYNRWQETRDLLGESEQEAADLAVFVAWMCIFDVPHGAEASAPDMRWLVDFGHALREREPADRLCERAARWLPSFSQFRKEMAGAFDGRYQAFSKLRESIERADMVPNNVRSALLGLAVSMVDPGSLKYAHLLETLVREYPTALLWYSGCAAVDQNFNPAGVLDGTGLRLLRELRRPVDTADSPTVDISLEELRVLSRGRLTVEHLKPSHPRLLRVGLGFGVEANVRLGSGEQKTVAVADPRLIEARLLHEKVGRLLSEMVHAAPPAEKAVKKRPSSKAQGTR